MLISSVTKMMFSSCIHLIKIYLMLSINTKIEYPDILGDPGNAEIVTGHLKHYKTSKSGQLTQ